MDDIPALRNRRRRKQFLNSGAAQALSRVQSLVKNFQEDSERAGGSRQFFVGVLGAGIRPEAKLPRDSRGRDERHAHSLGDNRPEKTCSSYSLGTSGAESVASDVFHLGRP